VQLRLRGGSFEGFRRWAGGDCLTSGLGLEGFRFQHARSGQGSDDNLTEGGFGGD
jgi:hypothetical protein